MTRARKFLELSFYINPGTARVFPGPGRYLSSLPEKYLAHPADATRDTKEVARHLQDLKKMILEEKLRKLETPKEYARSQEQETSLSPDEKDSIAGKHPTRNTKTTCRTSQIRPAGPLSPKPKNTIVIQFDDYGEKEMLKAFSQLKKIPNNN